MKKYNSYLLIAFFLFFITSFSLKNTNECDKVKNGKFYYYSKISRDKVDIERFDSIQLETNTNNGHLLRNKIIWKGDCKYDMFINALSNSKLKTTDSLIASTPATVEIKKIGTTYYICEWEMKILTKELVGTDTIYFQLN